MFSDDDIYILVGLLVLSLLALWVSLIRGS